MGASSDHSSTVGLIRNLSTNSTVEQIETTSKSRREMEGIASALAYGGPKDMPKGAEGHSMASSWRGALAEGPKVRTS